MNRSEHFARIEDRVDVTRLSDLLVVIVGVGTVGSGIAWGLANSSVGRLRLIDGDALKPENLFRHALGHSGQRYLGMNKAEAMTLHLDDTVTGVHTEAVPRDMVGELRIYRPVEVGWILEA